MVIGDRNGLIKPQALTQGDTSAIVSPSTGSAGLYPERFEKGIRQITELGFRAKVMPYALSSGRWASASVAERVSDLHEAFGDPSISGIICSIGGNGASQLLHALDFELIKANPKVFCGYSDITSLHTAIRQRSHLVTFYGPSVLAEFGDNAGMFSETRDAFLTATTSGKASGAVKAMTRVVRETADWTGSVIRSARPGESAVVVRDGLSRGHLVGGCLPVVSQLIGTPWALEVESEILVLETPQLPYSVDRGLADLWHLRNSGVFDSIAGLVVGLPAGEGELDELADCIRQVTHDKTYPVLVGLPFGHTSPMVTLPLGTAASIHNGALFLDESGVTSSSRTRSGVPRSGVSDRLS